MRSLRPLRIVIAIFVLGAIPLTAQTKINLDGFDDSEVPPDLAIKDKKVAGGIERTGTDSSGRVYFEMTVDDSGNPIPGSTITKNVYDAKGNTVNMLLDEEGKLIPRVRGALYCYIVPGPNGHFLRKAWLAEDGTVLEEERRAYDEQGRLVVEGYVDPDSGAYTEEYRHRYSEDGKIQFTTEFLNGVQKGPETSHEL
jgi:hypothetical protein